MVAAALLTRAFSCTVSPLQIFKSGAITTELKEAVQVLKERGVDSEEYQESLAWMLEDMEVRIGVVLVLVLALVQGRCSLIMYHQSYTLHAPRTRATPRQSL